jgi:hypothetical protein
MVGVGQCVELRAPKAASHQASGFLTRILAAIHNRLSSAIDKKRTVPTLRLVTRVLGLPLLDSERLFHSFEVSRHHMKNDHLPNAFDAFEEIA